MFCPYCGSEKVEQLPGKVVWQCLNLKCWWAFQKDELIGVDKPPIPADAEYAINCTEGTNGVV